MPFRKLVRRNPIAAYEWLLLKAHARKARIYPSPLTPAFVDDLASYIADRWWVGAAKLHEAAKASIAYIRVRLSDQDNPPRYISAIDDLLNTHRIVRFPERSDEVTQTVGEHYMESNFGNYADELLGPSRKDRPTR